MILASKTLVMMTTAATTAVVLLTGWVALAEGLTIETPYILAFLTGAGGVIALLFRLLIASKDREFAMVLAEKDRAMKDSESAKKSYQEIAVDAVRSATATTNFYRAREGNGPLVTVPAVVPESHSPSTPAQREAAEIQTLRARMEAVKLASGQPPRTPQTSEDAASLEDGQKVTVGWKALLAALELARVLLPWDLTAEDLEQIDAAIEMGRKELE